MQNSKWCNYVLTLSSSKAVISCSIFKERQIFFIDSRADEKIRVVGVATLPENANPNTLAWRSPGGTEIIVGCANGTIIEVNALHRHRKDPMRN